MKLLCHYMSVKYIFLCPWSNVVWGIQSLIWKDLGISAGQNMKVWPGLSNLVAHFFVTIRELLVLLPRLLTSVPVKSLLLIPFFQYSKPWSNQNYIKIAESRKIVKHEQSSSHYNGNTTLISIGKKQAVVNFLVEMMRHEVYLLRFCWVQWRMRHCTHSSQQMVMWAENWTLMSSNQSKAMFSSKFCAKYCK